MKTRLLFDIFVKNMEILRKKMVREHPERNWKLGTLSDLVRKIDKTGEIDERKGLNDHAWHERKKT